MGLNSNIRGVLFRRKDTSNGDILSRVPLNWKKQSSPGHFCFSYAGRLVGNYRSCYTDGKNYPDFNGIPKLFPENKRRLCYVWNEDSMGHSYLMFCPVACTYHFLFSGLSNLKMWATLTKPTWHSQLGILEVRKT